MKDTLTDMFAHQAWANAEHWRAIRAHAPAAADRAIRDRLHHIVLVEQLFLWLARRAGDEFCLTKSDDYADLAALEPEAMRVDKEMIEYVRDATPDALARDTQIAWFKDPPLTIPLEQALLQAAMHSHYHRGQNATRLRELGGEPPLTDYILWLWKNKPSPEWP